jgi:hypothetical protein
MNNTLLITLIRLAGLAHFVTLAFAHFTPVPRNWDDNLATLPLVHRRFAMAQNVFIGGTIALLGVVSTLLAPDLATGSPIARAWCAATALWWGGRLCTLPWLHVWPELKTTALRTGFGILHLECAAFGIGYSWLAVRVHA